MSIKKSKKYSSSSGDIKLNGARPSRASGRSWTFAGLTATFIIAVTAILVFALKPDEKEPPVNTSAGVSRIIEVSLEINAPFSTAMLVVNRSGGVQYTAQDRSLQTNRSVSERGMFSEPQMIILDSLIDSKGFYSLENRPQDSDDPLDGSTFTISAILSPPEGSAELEDAESYQVSCYEFACEEHFIKIKDFITESYGKELLEIGV